MFALVCTVICRWSATAATPVQMLALRDELAGRTFDTPDVWWPGQPGIVGGRDHRGGGTWSASDVRHGVSAVVLNRPDKPRADAGAPSRGVLPLLAVQATERWPEQIDVAPMASFNLVVASPTALLWWSYDGAELRRQELPVGTHMFTPRGRAEPLPDPRFGLETGGFHGDGETTDEAWHDWLTIVGQSEPSEDPLDLIVRIPVADDTFETVFGQFIAARPGSLRLDYTRRPDRSRDWTVARWTAREDGSVVRATEPR